MAQNYAIFLIGGLVVVLLLERALLGNLGRYLTSHIAIALYIYVTVAVPMEAFVESIVFLQVTIFVIWLAVEVPEMLSTLFSKGDRHDTRT